MFSLAAWYYRKLLSKNDIIEAPDFYSKSLLDGKHVYESNVSLSIELRPNWLIKSQLYKDSDGTGTDKLKNVAIYKAISEALERLAFYQSIDNHPKSFCFDLNPTTTGLAAFPSLNYTIARNLAKIEAIERWAIHEFNRSGIPILIHSCSIKNFTHYELVTPFSEVKISILEFKGEKFNCYGFAGGITLQDSYEKALVELSRNHMILETMKRALTDISRTDSAVLFFSRNEGKLKFDELVAKAPKKIVNNNPLLICDKPISGQWTKYTKVWRWLLEDSYEHNAPASFFMF